MRTRLTSAFRGVSIAAAAVVFASCSTETPEPFRGVDLALGAPEYLSEMNLMEWDGEKISYAPGVERYDLNTWLFSDYSLKDRAIYMPKGTAATYRENEVFDFPVGTVILKSFMFPADFRSPTEDIDLIETRVLVRFEDEWKAFPYVWDHELGDAVLRVQGDVQVVEFIDEAGVMKTSNYLVPQKNQCSECHLLKDLATEEDYMTPVGPKARHLNRVSGFNGDGVNQLEHLRDAGLLLDMPPMAEVGAAYDFTQVLANGVDSLDPETIETAARDYLDINCAHCHNPEGVSGISSQLFLNYDNTDQFHLGVCKKPGSAGKGGEGRTYDIVPGDPEASILIYRTETEELGAMMPLIGRSLPHTQGMEVLRAWIAAMPPDDCETEPSP
ncbi:MAG: SO2930 family diheme c-type cytochrome [Nannocystaceae bacterium]